MKKNMHIGSSLESLIKEQMKSSSFRKAWNELDGEFSIVESLIRARERAGLTQQQLAKKVGTRQPTLSRLERGGYRKATFETLSRIANELGFQLVLRPKKRQAA